MLLVPASIPIASRVHAVVIAGVICSLGEFQLEPAAAPQASFLLVRRRGLASVVVALPAPIPCVEGDRAVIAGDLVQGGGLPPVLLSPRILSCRPPP